MYIRAKIVWAHPHRRCIAKIPGFSKHEARALQDVTSIYFNEERNELYVGNRTGVLYVWAQ